MHQSVEGGGRSLLPAKVGVAYVLSHYGKRGRLKSPQRLGTAFAVSRRVLLTARHCVSAQLSAGHDQVEVGFVGRERRLARIELVANEPRMVKLVLGDSEIPAAKVVLNFAPSAPNEGQHWRAIGFPQTRRVTQPTTVSGTITALEISADDDEVAIALFCEQSAAGQILVGMSGGPVAARFGDKGLVFGLIDYGFKADLPDRADGGTLYAIPTSMNTHGQSGCPGIEMTAAAQTVKSAIGAGMPGTYIEQFARGKMEEFYEFRRRDLEGAQMRVARRSSYWHDLVQEQTPLTRQLFNAEEF
jgi:hypothetical protein